MHYVVVTLAAQKGSRCIHAQEWPERNRKAAEALKKAVEYCADKQQARALSTPLVPESPQACIPFSCVQSH